MSTTSPNDQGSQRTEVPTQTVTNTGIGNLITKCLQTRQAINIPEYTTLNEFHGILGAESIGPKQGSDFTLKYFGVGVRGNNCVGVDPNGVSIMKVNQHQPIDANLFMPIPMACRPLSNDFDPMTRALYRMRVVKTINNTAYAFYYLKLINFDNYSPKLLKIMRDEEGTEEAVPFIPVKDDLFETTPIDFTSDGLVPLSNTYINSSAILDCSLSNLDLQEIRNACLILFNDESYASISEVAICYGIDTQTDGQIDGGATIRYLEVLSAVIAHFVCEKDGRSATNNIEVNLAFNHGASEPMLISG